MPLRSTAERYSKASLMPSLSLSAAQTRVPIATSVVSGSWSLSSSGSVASGLLSPSQSGGAAAAAAAGAPAAAGVVAAPGAGAAAAAASGAMLGERLAG